MVVQFFVVMFLKTVFFGSQIGKIFFGGVIRRWKVLVSVIDDAVVVVN